MASFRIEYTSGLFLNEVKEYAVGLDMDICPIVGSNGWWTPKPSTVTRLKWLESRMDKIRSEWAREAVQIDNVHPQDHPFTLLAYQQLAGRLQYELGAASIEIARVVASYDFEKMLEQLRDAYTEDQELTYELIA